MTDKRVLYVNPIPYGANAGVDAIGQGLDWRLGQAGIEMRVITCNFLDADFPQRLSDAIDQAIDKKVDGILLYVLEVDPLREPTGRARSAGVPVFTFARAPFEVDAALTYPNFNHGVYMTEWYSTILPKNGSIAVIGGPVVTDDQEMLAGIQHIAPQLGLRLLNQKEMWEDRHSNRTDATPGGREAALRLLEDIPQMDGVFPYNDETMFGTLQALEETGRLGTMKVISRNGTPQAVQAVREGRTNGTWDLDAPQMSFPLADLMTRKLRGEDIGVNEVVMSPIGRMIHAGNVDRWVPWEERVSYSPFREGL